MNKLIVGLVALLMLMIVVPGFYMMHTLKSRTTPLMSTVGTLSMVQAADNVPTEAAATDEPSEPAGADLQAAASVVAPSRTVLVTGYAAPTGPAIASAPSHSVNSPTTQAP